MGSTINTAHAKREKKPATGREYGSSKTGDYAEGTLAGWVWCRAKESNLWRIAYKAIVLPLN